MREQKKHRVLVIGGGGIGQIHLHRFQATGRAEMGICEIDDALRSDTASRLGVEHVYGSLAHALDEPWDAAVICVPTNLHIPIALRVAAAGIHMLIEKPLAVSQEGVTELMDRARERRLFVSVGYIFRSHPALRGMRKTVRSRHLGKPLQIVLVRGANLAHRRPDYPNIYYADRARGGGAIQDILTHMFNAAEWLVGPITRLTADAAHMSVAHVDVEDTVHVLARHSNVMGCYTLNQHQAPGEFTISVNCEKGTARGEFHRHRWSSMEQPDGDWKEHAPEVADMEEVFTLQSNAFLDGLEGRDEAPCSLSEARQTLRATLAALASADREGAWQIVDTGSGPNERV